MPTTRTRRIVRRAVIAVAVTVLLLAGYVGSGPIVLCTLRDTGALARFPVLFDVCVVAYAPGAYWYDHPELPGHHQWVRYCNWSVEVTSRYWKR